MTSSPDCSKCETSSFHRKPSLIDPQICIGSLYQRRDNTKFTAPLEEVS